MPILSPARHFSRALRAQCPSACLHGCETTIASVVRAGRAEWSHSVRCHPEPVTPTQPRAPPAQPTREAVACPLPGLAAFDVDGDGLLSYTEAQEAEQKLANTE